HSAIALPPREPWVFEEPIFGILREFLKLRYKLMPYLYTLAWEASETGHPLIRPLMWHSPQDPNTLGRDDCFLLGNHVLVYPVLDPAVTELEVYLPDDTWYSYWDDELFEGGGSFTVPIELTQIPLFVKAGAILPLETETGLELHLYAPARDAVSSKLYRDAGDGYGDWRLDTYQVEWEVNHLVFTHREKGSYVPEDNTSLILHGARIKNAWIDEEPVSISNDSVLKVSECKRIRIELKEN
ncbi:MAG: hypothetical protein JXA19_06930, partial [Anaerolineales bacterium]|nr:hypothetical protein [Anaerolineales bacterium]